MLNEKEVKRLIDNPMKPTDTFKFSCKACGNCCRKREEPIMLTGYGVFRIAKGLRIEMTEVINKYTIGYVGGASKLPVLILKERQDGSCSLLRNGKCMVHDNKPLVATEKIYFLQNLSVFQTFQFTFIAPLTAYILFPLSYELPEKIISLWAMHKKGHMQKLNKNGQQLRHPLLLPIFE